MTQDEAEYFYNRAERQLELAQRSDLPRAVAAHYEMANIYLDKMARSPEPVAT